MADKKITELSSVSTLPDGAVFTAVDSTRSAGDQNVKISKADLATGICETFSATENQYGIHPAFNSQNEAIIWLLGKVSAPVLSISNQTETTIDINVI